MSGDMFMGALVDAGVSPELLEKTVAALDIGARLEISRVQRSGIAATKVDVYVHGQKDMPRDQYFEQHEHEHPHADTGEHSHSHHHEPAHDHGRGLKQIREIINRAAIRPSAKATALQIFEALGQAEAAIHLCDIEKVHFHEVGAADAMVDIVCAAVGAEALGVDEFVCSPLNIGGGTVKCAHGELPVPAPATVELLKGAPVYTSGIEKELVTPTGAAIVKVLAKRFGAFPEMTIEKSGYGAGTRELPGRPNVVRLTIGESQPNLAAKTSEEMISVLEANLDDLNPQVFGYVMDKLLEEGALDVFGLAVQMKKNRPGTLLTVLCKPDDASRMTQIVFSETTTLGVRRRDEKRTILSRKMVTVATPWGDVRLKLASMNGTVTHCAPEYEDCRQIAARNHVPLKRVMQEAVQSYLSGRAS